ncbi:MAG: hypothetical protein NG740_04900 [Omnitrophica bacterium]|nr:hypothetical protein [Candidatus Omnitrophota bacterium]
MLRRILFTFLAFTFISFMVTGCAKKEKPEEKKAAQKKFVPAKRPAPSDAHITEERVIFSFEDSLDGWEIPEWAIEKDDHVAEKLEISKDVAKEGRSSAKVTCDFSGKRWTAAVIELEQFYDFTPYREIAVDVFIPDEAPMGLKGKIILTIGDDWKFAEMTRSSPLVPGEWIAIKANIEPGSYDWKRIVPDDAFRADVRKIVVRVESNKSPVYKGPVYIDNMRIGK